MQATITKYELLLVVDGVEGSFGEPIDDVKQWKLNTFTSAAAGGILGSLRPSPLVSDLDREVPRDAAAGHRMRTMGDTRKN
jgi:hypothetical protein